jgi:hypothetical protein
MEPPGAGDVVADAKVPEGVIAVETTTDEEADTERVGSAWTMAADDLALSVPVQFEEAMVGVSVYFHEPAPGVSLQVTTDADTEQLPLMVEPLFNPTR